MISTWIFLLALNAQAKTAKYDLKATLTPVNLSGKKTVDFAIALNGQIPAPVLEFTEGDDAEITVSNHLPAETLSIHWHGILLPPRMDGVPYLTTPPIPPGESLVFRFKIRQHGTYWYHSHTGVQEQKGVFGPIVIHPKKSDVKVNHDVVAVLSDWSDENPEQILRNLRKDGDYYLAKKNTVRSLWGAWRAGGLSTYFMNEWTRMGGMDLSDVGYDAFLINGKKDSQLVSAKKGEKVRVRVINASGSTYFTVSLGGLSFKTVAADGSDIMPVETKSLFMGMAETYDLIFTVPKDGNYELRATAQDGTGYASAWIGGGDKVTAQAAPMPNLYAPMVHDAHGGHGGHSGHGGGHMDHGHTAGPVENLGVDDYMALDSTELKSEKVHDLRFELDGDMRRYVWYINGKSINQDRFVDVAPGELVRITYVNKSMMHHPMHLHGHFFRVLNPHGDYSPLKHTVDVPPHGERVIEFIADEPGQWMLHCHNLFHMKMGMARVINYTSFKPDADILEMQRQDPHLHDHAYWSGLLDAASNHAKGRLSLSRTWDAIEGKIEARDDGSKWEVEGDAVYRRWFGKNLSVFGGGESFHEEQRAKLGVGYLLPMLIESEVAVDHLGKLRLDLMKRFQWTSAVFTNVEFTFRQQQTTEYEISLMYGPAWSWSAGLMLTERNLGAGFEYRF